MRASRRLVPVSWLVCLALPLAWACGGDDGGNPVVDAGSDASELIDGSEPCTEDSECDDGQYCNGVEFCDETQCKRGARINCDDGIECTVDVCSESASMCRNLAPDFDGDGHRDAFCLDKNGEPIGDDCDDDNGNRFPGNIEVCDADSVDEDCNPSTFGNKDQDHDGEVDSKCCNTNATGTLVCGSDCDDLKPSVNAGSSEVCDLYDNDCDGETDEEGAVMLFVDADFDGHGAAGSEPVPQCAGTLGFSSDDDDCDDEDPAVHKAQVEICDEKDNDCDNRVDESPRAVLWYRDSDGDKFGGSLEVPLFQCAPPVGYDLRSSDCDDTDAAINPAAAELCDGIDNNCDKRKTARVGVNNFEDDDDDGSADFACGNAADDCDDNDKSTGGNLVEICDKLDNDCDDLVDENVADTVWYVDADGDGFGNERLPAVVFCAPLAGRSAYPGDCNDSNPNIHPGAFEVCSLDVSMSEDENCNGQIDEGFCPVCGDGIMEGPEQCDDRAKNGADVCADPDHVCNDDTIVDACRENCQLAHCGDGVLDTGEQCDEGMDNSEAPNATCRPDCRPRRCGDGVFDNRTELCEPGAGVNGDICVAGCLFRGWEQSGCSMATPVDLGSAVGPSVVVGANTGAGRSDVVFDPTPDPTLDDCGFTGAAPMGPELTYKWLSPASLIYAFNATNGALPSRLTLGVFWDGGNYPTSCVVPLVCQELVPASLRVAQMEQDDPTVIVVDSQSAQTFDLRIQPLLCCPSIDSTDLNNLGSCVALHNQAQLDCALTSVPPACLTDWTATCVATADAACANYTCP